MVEGVDWAKGQAGQEAVWEDMLEQIVLAAIPMRSGMGLTHLLQPNRLASAKELA